jgi:PLD-like domain
MVCLRACSCDRRAVFAIRLPRRLAALRRMSYGFVCRLSLAVYALGFVDRRILGGVGPAFVFWSFGVTLGVVCGALSRETHALPITNWVIQTSMAKFLTTSGITFHLENLIKGAKEKLILISPYLKICDRIRLLLEDKNRDKIDIRMVYGKNDLQPEEHNWIKSNASIRLSFCRYLHAKCYLSETHALITSMNLYEYSQVNNDEMGVLVTKAEDAAMYAEVYEESMRLIRSSDEVRVTVEKVVPAEHSQDANSRKTGRGKASAPEKGHCIRCKADIKADPSHPYCRDCYTKWKQYENPEYVDEFCHLCAKSGKTTMRKPVCPDCYRQYKDILTFAS